MCFLRCDGVDAALAESTFQQDREPYFVGLSVVEWKIVGVYAVSWD
ncbi:MAG: hypothetical protein KME20_00395 [Kaiparowitsia implicata GSE-PSE-MK54-09C]|jgi:hypothetical protein|nr:hypothetical protein [Kaiparowitsia implicata GSE-PSE-MK54-09C]